MIDRHKQVRKRQMFYLAILAFGLAFASSLQISNMSSLFKFLGANGSSLPYLWLAAPITGMVVQPIIGQLSDDTATRWGKRRPYIFVWGLLAALSYLVLPFAGTLTLTVLLIWFMDCSINGCYDGLRALIGDTTPGEQRAKAFAMQAILAGFGAAIGAGLPFLVTKLYQWFGHMPTLKLNALPDDLKISFMITAVVLACSVMWMLHKVKEKAYTHSELLKKKQQHRNAREKLNKMFKSLYHSALHMPKPFRDICIVHFITWIGIFTLWLYFTMTLAQNIYDLPLHANVNSSPHFERLLQNAALDSSLYISIYQYVSVACAIVLFLLPSRINPKPIHALSLLIGALGLTYISFATTLHELVVCMVAVGIMWGSVIVLPYAIATQSVPKGKMGSYLGLFNIAITLPQIMAGLTLGPIYAYVFRGHAGYVLILGGVLILSAAILLWRQYKAEQRHADNRYYLPIVAAPAALKPVIEQNPV